MNTGVFPNVIGKLDLAFTPTPLEYLPRLSAALGGADIWVKRDDCTGLGGGGNKTRKLEYLIADAIAQGADTVITAGALQSNHARQTAAAAARSGLRCVLVLAAAVPGRSASYADNGNMLLDRIFGAETRLLPADADLAAEMQTAAQDVSAKGGKPYIIPVGGSNALGAVAYAMAMQEFAQQCEARDLAFSDIVMATGSGGTQAGMIAGAAALGLTAKIHGVSVSGSAQTVTDKVSGLAAETMTLLQAIGSTSERVLVDDGFVGDGYGQPTEGVVEALQSCARNEGLLLDPVYTGKAMAALFQYIRTRKFKHGKVLFWHTGGAQGLFAYPELF